jgi:hypothetical protein
VKGLGVQVVTVCKDAEVVVKMLEYVLAYVEVSVTTDSCTAAAGVAEQAAVGVVEEDTSGEGSTEGDRDDVKDGLGRVLGSSACDGSYTRICVIDRSYLNTRTPG